MKSRHLLSGLALSASLVATMFATDLKPALPATATESAKANAFFERAFEDSIALSPQTMAQLGMKKDYDKWDDQSEQAALDSFLLGVQQLAELKRTINFDALDEQTRVSYRLFVSQGEQSIEGWRWRYHNYPLDQMNGMHSGVPSFLISFHSIDNVADAHAYIARLRGIAPLFAQVIEGVKLRESKGIVPPKFVFPIVIQASRDVITGEPFDQSGKKCALLDDFEKKVGELKDVDAGTKAHLITEARAALVEAVKPAYESLIGLLEAQEKIATTDDGVWKFPNGREFYDYELRMKTTTNLTSDQVHELGLREVARIHAEMEVIKNRVGFKGDLAAFFKYLKEDPQFYFPETPEGRAAYLKQANEIIDDMRASLDRFFTVKPKAALVVKAVEPFRAAGEASAFYEQPAPDGTRPGTYYVNTIDMARVPKFEMETLAHHEAIPGHHMQIAIAQELADMPKFRKYGGYTAYDEGWALYSEYFPKEYGFYHDPYMDFGRLSEEILRAVRLVVDTGIHAKHWTREQVIEYFRKNTPKSENELIAETNRYIVWPGQATAYKVGMLKILELRELAKEELGPKFDIRAYHDLVLHDGAVPLDILEENVRAWIAKQKKS